MLVWIEGGPEKFANQAFPAGVGGGPSNDILEHPDFIAILDQYRSTSRTVTSAKDPSLVAQVWVHVSMLDQSPAPSPVPSAADDPHATASDLTTQEEHITPFDEGASTSTESSGLPPGEAPEHVAVAPLQVTNVPESEEELDARVQEASEDYTGAAPDVSADDDELPSGEQLFLRRKKLKPKHTVQDVADAVGLARSRVDAIEKGTAVRGDVNGDVRKVHEFLLSREEGSSPRA